MKLSRSKKLLKFYEREYKVSKDYLQVLEGLYEINPTEYAVPVAYERGYLQAIAYATRELEFIFKK